MSQRVLITGGSGFVGRAVSRRLVQSGIKVISCSRSGAPAFHADENHWTSSPLIDWVNVDCLESEQMNTLIETYKPTAYVHAVGALLEKSNYKSVIDPFTSIASLAGMLGGNTSSNANNGNSSSNESAHPITPDYNVINRDSLSSVVDCVNRTTSSTSTTDTSSKIPFVFVSAFAAPPLVDQRYIESKREAEEILFSSRSLRPIVMRPGFLYSEERDWSMALAGLLQLSSSAHKGPLVGISSMVRSMLPPGVDMSFAVHPPLRVEILADAIVQSILEDSVFGILEGSDINNTSNSCGPLE